MSEVRTVNGKDLKISLKLVRNSSIIFIHHNYLFWVFPRQIMAKKQKKAKQAVQTSNRTKVKIRRTYPLLPWLLIVAGITAVFFFPMLFNKFTNWDDEYYVVNNQWLRGPDLGAILTQPLLGNYHPLTVLSYAFNYAISGLHPFSYHLVNYLLHLANTLLVFYFIWNISGKNKWVALFVSLVFGVHPMHVESVAWIAERKDVLYTFFFLLSLIQYWKYLSTNNKKNFWICFAFFVLSLLSKPAAIVLPLVLLLLDFWKGRKITWGVIAEKIPFFLCSIAFGIITVMIQSSSAMIGLHVFSIKARLYFACYVLMTYFYRFFVPYPLSAFHNFPLTNDPGYAILLSPIFIAVLIAAFWFFRKNKVFVFGMLFFITNLLLVLQILSIGLTIVSERYTYVPYIGLAFTVAMLVSRIKIISPKLIMGAASLFILILGIMTFQRTKVWKNSGTLWTDALKYAPNAPYARTNRANYLSKLALRSDQKPFADSIYKVAFEDCRIALSVWPNHAPAFEYRAYMHLDRGEFNEALADANELVRLKPQYRPAYDIRATAYFKTGQPEKALEDYKKCTQLSSNDHRSFYNVGLILYSFKRYDEAIPNLSRAISIRPLANYYVYRALCYLRKGDVKSAKADALIAAQKNAAIPDDLKPLLQ